jgi:hypothetical protein
MFLAPYRAIAFCLWFGVMFVIATVVVAIAVVAVLACVAFGLACPSRTPKSMLNALAVNTGAAITHVRALEPS